MAKFSLKLTKRYLRDLKLARKRGMDESLRHCPVPADLRLMKMKKAAHGWTAYIEKKRFGRPMLVIQRRPPEVYYSSFASKISGGNLISSSGSSRYSS